MRKLTIIVMLLLFARPLFAQEEKLHALLEQYGIPGIQLVYTPDGKMENFNLGTIGKESAKKVTSNTVFEAASLGKAVFAYIVLRLYDRGVLSLDTPLIRYAGSYDRFYPGDPRYALITARMVLRHTSGLPNWGNQQGAKLLFSPDSTFSYSGEGFQYLQYAVEKLTGKPLNDLAQQEVFRPLGMPNSSYAWDSKFDTLAAFGNSPEAIAAHSRQRAASSLLTCARDYAVFLQALMSGRGLKPETHRLMLEKQSAGNWYRHRVTEANQHIWWGLGIGLEENETGKWIWQWGDNGDFKGFYIGDPATGTALVYFTHSYLGLRIMPDILDAFFPRQTWWPALWTNYQFQEKENVLRFWAQLERQGYGQAAEIAQSLGRRDTAFRLPEKDISDLGFILLGKGMKTQAVEVFNYNVTAHPGSSSAYNCLAQGDEAIGDNASALANYKTDLKLNPTDSYAAGRIKKLEEQPVDLAPVKGAFTDRRDGRTYTTVTIGHEVWFAENFAYLPEVDTLNISVYGYKGRSVREAKRTASYQIYGALYSWALARKLAPPGWHLPTDADWQLLEKQIGVDQKAVDTMGWRGNNREADRLKAGGSTGFNVLFGGWRSDRGRFNFQGQHANFWCADSYDAGRAYETLIGFKNGRIGRDVGNKGCGFSVRYVRDMPDSASVSYPGRSWEQLPGQASFGWNSDKLRQLYNFVRDSTFGTGVLVIQSGKVLFQYGDTEELSYVASDRKSLLSMLYGKYVDNGTINLNKTLAELGIDDIGGLSAGEKQATILDLLESRSGVFHAASNEGDNAFLFPKRGSKAHGSHFVYNNWDFNVAGYVFEKETGQNIYQAFDRDIARPIGLQDWDTGKQFKGGDTTKSRFRAYVFVLSTRDMARLGYLMLRDGRWEDRQVIPADWVKRSTTITTSLEEMKKVDPRLAGWPWWKWGYGLLWWLWDSPDQHPELDRAYTAHGNLGQYITVIPGMDVVIAFKTKEAYHRRTEHETYVKFIDRVIEAKK